jgi:hypothetical protein
MYVYKNVCNVYKNVYAMYMKECYVIYNVYQNVYVRYVKICI